MYQRHPIQIADLTTIAERVPMDDGKEYDIVRFTVLVASKSLQKALGLANGATMYGTVPAGQTTDEIKRVGWGRTPEEAVSRRNTLIDLDRYL